MVEKTGSYKTGSYKDLVVWQQAMDLAVAVYGATKSWPKEELYGLTSQMRRAASSVPSNIAEGYGREIRGSYQQFLRIAQGSLKELETQILIAERTGIAPKATAVSLLEGTESVGKLLRLLIRKLSTD
ncbi:MAG: four helix bundle protein [Mesorhizobium sp.]|uniref:four helix bundle protein n=1 Tax=Mesorhizobium sp. TaxID=1871066 RepID=UPI001217DE3F|nr:four helix bundle protein [Mesorhizobium sp.]TIQ38071.1 MAG: four helix bundle protein [Mesorhizobium sp.]